MSVCKAHLLHGQHALLKDLLQKGSSTRSHTTFKARCTDRDLTFRFRLGPQPHKRMSEIVLKRSNKHVV